MDMIPHHGTTGQPPPTSTAGVIRAKLDATRADYQALSQIADLSLRLQRAGLMESTRRIAVAVQCQLGQELALLRATLRHLEHQAKVECAAACDATRDGAS